MKNPDMVMKLRHKPKAISALIVACSLFTASPSRACCNSDDDKMIGGYGFGLGVGQSQTTGDFIQGRRTSVFSMGFDAEKNGVLFMFTGLADTNSNSEMSSYSLILGGGWSYFKIGTGLINQKSSAPTTNMVEFPLIITDSSRLTTISVTTIPVFLRLHPLITDRLVLTVDGYYGLRTRGSTSIPVDALGMQATMDTDTKHAGGARGIGSSAAWRLGSSRFGLKFEYRVSEQHMDRNTTGFQGDVLGAFSTVKVPDITYRNRTMMLSIVGSF